MKACISQKCHYVDITGETYVSYTVNSCVCIVMCAPVYLCVRCTYVGYAQYNCLIAAITPSSYSFLSCRPNSHVDVPGDMAIIAGNPTGTCCMPGLQVLGFLGR